MFFHIFLRYNCYMKYKWLNKGVNKGVNNGKLILFFNGWGMDENVVKHLE